MSDDLIRRSDAIKAFTFNLKGERIPFVDCDNFPVEFPLRYIVDTLVALPSTDRPQGHYIKGENGEWYCSNCKRIDDKYSVARFCWYCGARMKGVEDAVDAV